MAKARVFKLLKVSVVDLIYRAYHRAGMEPPSQKDLLDMTPPEDDTWKLYKTGCTLGLNQVEQPGTSSRVGKYAPTNISELCAFVAAIRPGFKSMYKTFESRQHFDYGVEQFDDLIRTEEMPNSFLLYQEHIMAALHYAGITMSEAYTVIKAISKKRVEKIMAYKDQFVTGLSAKLKTDGSTEEEATEIAKRLWQIIEDSSSYSFNASHSYCVSLDSVYSAWIKAHYPLAFYETLLQIQEDKGKKDKMVEIKREAEEYFKITFPPYRFGQDNRAIRANFERGEIHNSIKAIKGLPKTSGELLWEVAAEEPKTMTDVLFACKHHKVTDATIEALSKIGYFAPFGNDVEIFRIIAQWQFYKKGEAKKIKRDVVQDPTVIAILQRYATDTNDKGEPATTYTITSPDIEAVDRQIKATKKAIKAVGENVPAELTAELESLMEKGEEVHERWEQAMLNEIEQYILSLGLQDLDYRNKAQNQTEVLGYVDLTTGKEEDRRKLVIEDVVSYKSKTGDGVWCYRVNTRSIGSGKAARLTIKPGVFEETPLKKGDVIFTPQGSLKKNSKGYWYLSWYDILA